MKVALLSTIARQMSCFQHLSLHNQLSSSHHMLHCLVQTRSTVEAVRRPTEILWDNAKPEDF